MRELEEKKGLGGKNYFLFWYYWIEFYESFHLRKHNYSLPNLRYKINLVFIYKKVELLSYKKKKVIILGLNTKRKLFSFFCVLFWSVKLLS